MGLRCPCLVYGGRLSQESWLRQPSVRVLRRDGLSPSLSALRIKTKSFRSARTGATWIMVVGPRLYRPGLPAAANVSQPGPPPFTSTSSIVFHRTVKSAACSALTSSRVPSPRTKSAAQPSSSTISRACEKGSRGFREGTDSVLVDESPTRRVEVRGRVGRCLPARLEHAQRVRGAIRHTRGGDAYPPMRCRWS